MKKCPTCDKEFPDSMKFCQTDGTLLVDAAPPADPYKTTVANQDEIKAAIPPQLDPFKTMVAPPPSKPAEEDLLQLPDEPIDNLKTMVVSQDELREELKSPDVPPLDLPAPAPPLAPSAPLIEPKKPAATPGDVSAPPKPSAPPSSSAFSGGDSGLPKPSAPIAGDVPPIPPSPFDSKPMADNDFTSKSPYGSQDNKPIPSPFQDSMPPGGYQPPIASPFQDAPPASPFDAPQPPPFKEPEPTFGGNQQESSFQPPSPFGEPATFQPPAPIEQSGWAPPPAPVSEWGNQELGSNTPFQPPAAGAAAGQNQTLPIVSLILGILSICCYIGWITGPAALITGYMGMKNANNDPNQFGGKGLAIAGMVVGGLFTLIWIIYWIFVILVYAGLFAGAALS